MNLYVSPSITKKTSSTSCNIYQFARENYGKQYEKKAWSEFLGMTPEDYEENKVFMEVFIPWYLYSWSTPEGTNIALDFIAENFKMLPAFEREFIRTSSANIYSFYQVQEVGNGHYLKIKDLVTNDVHLVFEKTASKLLDVGNIIFSKVGNVNRLRFLLSTTSLVISETFKDEIVAFAKKSKINRDSELRRILLYFSIVAEILAEDEGKIIPLHK